MLNENLLNKIFTKYKIDVVDLYATKIIVPESVQKSIDYYLTNVVGLSIVLKTKTIILIKSFLQILLLYMEKQKIK